MVFVLTVDQQGSRRAPDAVGPLLDDLAVRVGSHALLPFERTAGDELQGVLDDADCAVTLVLHLAREGRWSIGVGLGDAELPLPSSTRAGRGTAFIRAREAVEAAKRAPGGVVVVGAGPTPATDPTAQAGATDPSAPAEPGPPADLTAPPDAGRAGSALVDPTADAGALLTVLTVLRSRRTAQGWEATDLVAAGSTLSEAAGTLGISRQAVSQRLAAAAWEAEQIARPAAVRLLARAHDASTGAVETGAAGAPGSGAAGGAAGAGARPRDAEEEAR